MCFYKEATLAAAKTSPEVTTILDRLVQLRVPFPASDVKQRPGGGGRKLDYVAIETVLGRLLDNAPEYSWSARVVSFDFTSMTAIVEGHLTIGEKVAYGVGAMKNPDADMAVKSANSEAMKNAAKNGFGIALELWSEEHRANLEVARRAAGGDEKSLKKAVFDVAKIRLDKAKPTVAEVAKVFDVTPGELADITTLQEILAREGVL